MLYNFIAIKISHDKQNKVVIPSEISLKLIQYSLNLDIVPNCQIKWNIQYNSELPWKKIWINLNKSMSSRKEIKLAGKLFITLSIRSKNYLELANQIMANAIFVKRKTKLSHTLFTAVTL